MKLSGGKRDNAPFTNIIGSVYLWALHLWIQPIVDLEYLLNVIAADMHYVVRPKIVALH